MRLAANVLILGLLTAIGCDKQKVRTLASPTAAPPATTQNGALAQEGDTTSRLYLAGIKSPDDVRRFLDKLQKAINEDDRPTVVSLVRLPFTTYSHGKAIKTFSTKATVLDNYDRIFTPKVLHAISTARYETLFVNWQGVMIGNGEVWFDEQANAVKIKAING